MSKEFFGDRERALEDEFFFKVDQDLKNKLRAKLEAEQTAADLTKATGIKDAAVIDELVGLGITPETLLALSLFPCVQVAWADRVVDVKERNAVLKAAAEQGCDADDASYELLETWLQNRPSAEMMTAWRDYIAALVTALEPDSVAALKNDLTSRARAVATAAGGLLGFHAIAPAEEAVLKEMETAFEHGGE